MSKKTETEETIEVVAPVEKKSDQKVRWEAFLAKHKAQNPEKHAARLEKGLSMPIDF